MRISPEGPSQAARATARSANRRQGEATRGHVVLTRRVSDKASDCSIRVVHHAVELLVPILAKDRRWLQPRGWCLVGRFPVRLPVARAVRLIESQKAGRERWELTPASGRRTLEHQRLAATGVPQRQPTPILHRKWRRQSFFMGALVSNGIEPRAKWRSRKSQSARYLVAARPS